MRKKQDHDRPSGSQESGDSMSNTDSANRGIDQDSADELEIDVESAGYGEILSEIERLRGDVEEAQNRYLRTLADFDNFRKRQREETSRQIARARDELMLQLLPVVDNIERSIRSAEALHSYDALVEGVSLTMRQLSDVLAKEGVEPIAAVGQAFDPELHEAMMRVETQDCAENTVVEELEKGYTMEGRVLRPARVSVAVSPGRD